MLTTRTQGAAMLAALLITLLALAGCGGGDATEDECEQVRAELQRERIPAPPCGPAAK